ncbi:MAG: leucine-rich repeat domain-containing protein, partial [Gammaproteobacteria bacterium]|nr:leucine-rich repeat domain-containing protein [Gammaproteobacteria bacterium]
VLAHEFGHNMGLRHDRYVDAANTPSPYSHGYVNQRAFEEGAPASSRWRTIMAYVNQCTAAGFSCQRILRFSNPDLTYEGDPMGIAGESGSFALNGPADARRTLNETRDIIASFREAGPDLIVAITPPLRGRAWSAGQAGIILPLSGANEGRIESTATVGSIYRSADPHIGTDDTLLSTFDIEARGGKEVFSHAFVETAPAENGVYYYGACVDAVENETDTDNNCTPGLGVTVGPTVSVTDSRTAEGLDLSFSFNLSEAQSTDVTVQWELARGTAVDGLDYVDQSGTVTIPANQNFAVATVETVDDDIPEGDDTFTITVVETTGVAASFDGRQATGTIVDDDGDPTIRDENLRDAIYQALVKSSDEELTFDDLASLTGLNATGLGIASLDGLEAATALTNLVLDANSIEDLSPLAHLANLNRLQIAGNGIEDVSQLASVASLTFLDLDNNPIGDFSPLGSLSGLTALSLNRTGISDLSALQDLVALETLNADSNNITSIDGLENLARLATATLNSNEIADLTPLSGLLQLSYLGLGDNDIDDVSPLANVTRLTWLGLDRNSIADIAQLSGLSALTELHLFGNEVADLPDLSALRQLQVLGLTSNRLTDIGPIGSLPSLRRLHLSGNSITDISPLSDLTRLEYLYLDRNLIVDLSPLSGLNRLFFLSASDNRIRDLTGLAGMPRLFFLRLDGNAIGDVTPLADVGSLFYLDLSDNQIRDIEPLVDNAGLGFGDFVYLYGNPLDDVSVSEHVPVLQGRGITLYHIGLSVVEASVREGGDLEFAVRLSVPSSGDVVVDWRARAGSATEGDDYAGGQSGSVIVPADEVEAVFTVSTNEDDENEDHETVVVSVTAPDGGFARGVWLMDSIAVGLIVDPAGPVANVPVFAHANHDTRQGFVRVINRRGFNVVHVEAVDAAGNRHPTTLAMDAGETVHFNSNDLESGNIAKGLSRGVGQGSADWRLELRGNGVHVLTYMRTNDGFLTSLHDLVPAGPDGYSVPIFNPGRNTDQESLLKLINGGDADAAVTISGVDGRGASSDTASLMLAAGETRTISAAELERGTGLEGRLGTGSGKWRLLVTSDQPIGVAGLMQTPTGHLTNLSTTPDNTESATNGTAHHVYLFPSASDATMRQGFVRVVNRGGAGSVEIRAYDQTDNEYETVVLQMDADETVHFNSDDLETGNAAKGLSGSTGAGEGDWRLELTSALELTVLAYMRTEDGFLTSMHDTVPENAGVHHVPIFNPGSNRNQVSQLRLINAGDQMAEVTISGVDDTGQRSAGRVRVSLPAGKVRTVTSQALEAGAEDLDGALGDGLGKWSLEVNSETPIHVLNLLASPTGHLTNLSTRPAMESAGGAQSENSQ